MSMKLTRDDYQQLIDGDLKVLQWLHRHRPSEGHSALEVQHIEEVLKDSVRCHYDVERQHDLEKAELVLEAQSYKRERDALHAQLQPLLDIEENRWRVVQCEGWGEVCPKGKDCNDWLEAKRTGRPHSASGEHYHAGLLQQWNVARHTKAPFEHLKGDYHLDHAAAVRVCAEANAKLAPVVGHAAVILTVEPDGCVWLMKRLPPWPFSDQWAFPGGTVEPGETPLMAAQREMEEETGIIALSSRFTPYGPKSFHKRDDGSQFDIEYFLFEVREGEWLRNTEPEKHSDYHLFNVNYSLCRHLGQGRMHDPHVGGYPRIVTPATEIALGRLVTRGFTL